MNGRIDHAINWPPGLALEWPGGYADGATEPWIQQIVAALLVASHKRTVLELGSYRGHTAVWLCHTLSRMGGGEYLGVDNVSGRQAATLTRLSLLNPANVRYQVVQGDALVVLRSLPARSVGFAWVDDDHAPKHVAEELELLYNPVMPDQSKMVSGGIIAMHDVYGGEERMTPLRSVCVAAHGYALDFPRIGLLGGLGIVQVP